MSREVEGGILQVALPVPLPRLFDYLPMVSGAVPSAGQRVLVPFGGRKLVGIVVSEKDSSTVPQRRLLHLEKCLDEGPPLLDQSLLNLLDWCVRYYKHAPGEVFLSALPPVLRQASGTLPRAPAQYCLTEAGRERLAEGAGRAPVQHALLELLADGPKPVESLSVVGPHWRKATLRLVDQDWMVEEPLQPQTAQPEEGPALTGEQVKTLDRISPLLDRFQCHLVDGVTGSGKTEVYMRLLQMMFDRGRQALVLVPEIGLTPQLIRRFRQRLGIEPAVIHSRLTGGERLAAWNAARTGRSRLLLGTRSALFTPLPDLGLIVLDEEHDSSFKQQDGFRHSARDVAIKWAADLKIPVVLGSATPSLESVHNALNHKYVWHRMRKRATRAPQPRWRVLDMAQQPVASGLAAGTIEAIDETLRRGEQAMVFLNRRGYSPVLMCRECGWHAECSRCDANLTWHRAVGAMCCHHCGSRRPVPSLCPECRADAIFSAGEGTQQLEEALAGRFPGIPLLRFDRDQTSAKGVLDRQIEQVMSGERCIMVGTQILAKGHHFPNVTLVAIVNVDQALYSADYRALERLAQLIQQVAGRAGRADKPGEVILQTMHPEHQTLQLLLREGYESFARFLLQERQSAGLPPYGYQAMLRADAHDREDVDRFLSDALELWPRGDVSAFGPIPAIMEKRGGRMRMYLVMQSSLRPALHQQLDLWLPGVRELPSARKVRWVVDIDPQEM